MMDRILAGVLCPVLAATAMHGCASERTRAPEGIFRIASDAEPQYLDPYLVTGHTEHRILTSLFEGLTTLSQATLEVEPGAAKSWEISEDGLTYTFHLNPAAKWSDGTPCTAKDFVYGWRRMLTPKLGSEYSYMLWCIKNAEEYNKGKIADFDEVGVKAADDHTLVVHLNYPTPYLLSMQIHYSWFPVLQSCIEKHGAMDDRSNPWTLAGNMVSNGPFKLVEWSPNKIIRVVRNEHYWDADRIKLDGIEFHPVSGNLLLEERMFRAGKVDLIETLVLSKIPTYQKENPSVLRLEPFVGTYFYRINTTRKPFDDPRVRKALAMSVDRESICRDVTYRAFVPAVALTPPNLAGYTAEASIEYNVDEARRLLAEAGFPNGRGMRPVEILYNESEDHQMIAEAIQSMWKQNLGISVTTNKQEWRVYLNSMTTLNYDVARAAWIADFLDPINYIECFTTDNGNNRTGWSNARYDELERKARYTVDPVERFSYLQEAERILLDDAPIIPIYSYRQRYLLSPDVKGADANPLGYLNYRYFSVERASP